MNYQSNNLIERNQRLIPMYGKYKHKFMLQLQEQSIEHKFHLLKSICCADRKNLN